MFIFDVGRWFPFSSEPQEHQVSDHVTLKHICVLQQLKCTDSTYSVHKHAISKYWCMCICSMLVQFNSEIAQPFSFTFPQLLRSMAASYLDQGGSWYQTRSMGVDCLLLSSVHMQVRVQFPYLMSEYCEGERNLIFNF